VDVDRTLAVSRLRTPRREAAAAFVNGRGLFVGYGTNETAGSALPVTTAEFFVGGSSVAQELPYPPKSVRGAGAARTTTGRVVIAGGVDEAGAGVVPFSLDAACSRDCAYAEGPSPLPAVLARTLLFPLTGDDVVVLGTDPTQASRAFALRSGVPTEIPFRTARGPATAAFSPLASIVVAGGAADLEARVP
jgi:hypothetical protein